MDISKKAGKKFPVKIVLIAACAVFVAGAVIYGQNVSKKRAQAQATRDLVTEAAVRGDVSKEIVGTGIIATGDVKKVTVPEGVKIRELYIEQGDAVKKGDKIAKVDEVSLKQALLKAQQAIDDKKDEINELSRSDEYYDLKLEIAQAALNDLVAVKDDIERLGETGIITANASGVVSRLNVGEGDTVSSGMSLDGTGIDMGGDMGMDMLRSYLNIGSADPLQTPIVEIRQIRTLAAGGESEGSEQDAGRQVSEVSGMNAQQLQEEQAAQQAARQAQEELEQAAQQAAQAAQEEQEQAAQQAAQKAQEELEAAQQQAAQKAQEELEAAAQQAAQQQAAQPEQDASQIPGSPEAPPATETPVGTEGKDEGSGQPGTDDPEAARKAAEAAAAQAAEAMKKLQEQAEQQAGQQVAPERISLSDLTLSITAPKTGNAPQSKISIGDKYHTEVQIAWVPSTSKFEDDQAYTAMITLRAKDGYCFKAENGNTGVIVDSCKNATTAAFDTNFDGYIDTVVIACAYTTATDSLTDSQEELLRQVAEKMALEAMNQLAKNFPEVSKQLEKEIQKLEKTIAKSINNLTKDIAFDPSSMLGGLGSLGNMSSLFGGMDLSGMTSLGGSSSGSIEKGTIAAIVPTDKAFLDIQIDELDINQVQVGQSARITVEALEGRTYEGTITRVSQLSDGSGKYTVRIRTEKGEEMKFGMSATAAIFIEKRENVVSIPLEAVQTLNGRDVVYTNADADGNLLDPVEITTGLSDGDVVEVIAGLEEGQQICYFQTANNYSVFVEMESEMRNQQ